MPNWLPSSLDNTPQPPSWLRRYFPQLHPTRRWERSADLLRESGQATQLRRKLLAAALIAQVAATLSNAEGLTDSSSITYEHSPADELERSRSCSDR